MSASSARCYVAAGADCVYRILLADAQAIETFTKAVRHPVSILALPSAPSVAQLAEMGVARISHGSICDVATLTCVTASG